ncbi:hypothetical protein OROHE_004580 [Orobanche hederae]
MVKALHGLYKSLNKPMHLEYWRAEGGDPCGEHWTGVLCNGSSVINLQLFEQGLTGSLRFELSNLKNLELLDLSSNNIEGSIPRLPPSLTYLSFAENKFNQSFTHSIEKMKHLLYLNLSQNSLSGSLQNVFDGLEELEKCMDMSFNSFTGDLPISFRSLTNLTGFNQFTVVVHSLIPILGISKITISVVLFHRPFKIYQTCGMVFGGNNFVRETNYPLTDSIPEEQNIPASANFSFFENNPSQIERTHKRKKPNAAAIVLIVGGIILVSACAALSIIAHRQKSFMKRWRSLVSNEGSLKSLPTHTLQGFSSSPLIPLSHLRPIPKVDTIAELQIATHENVPNYATEPIQVPIGPITRARAKRFKDSIKGLVQIIGERELVKPIETDIKNKVLVNIIKMHEEDNPSIQD